MMILLVFADGGVKLFQSPAGPFEVIVFSKSEVRAGGSDFSVMVEKGSSAVMDATVILHVSRSDQSGVTRVTSLATHAKATNKTLYATTMNLPSPGTWKMEVDVTQTGVRATVAQNMEVLPALPPAATYWPYIALVPFAGLAFVLNRWLKRKMGVGRRR